MLSWTGVVLAVMVTFQLKLFVETSSGTGWRWWESSSLVEAICTGVFRNAARKHPRDGYRTRIDQQGVRLQPSTQRGESESVLIT